MPVRNVNMSLLVLLMLTAGVSMPDRFMDEADVMTRAAPPPQSSAVICGRVPMNRRHRSALGATRNYIGHMSHLDKNVNEMPHLNEPVSDEPDLDTYVGDEPRLYTNIRHEPETDQHVSDEPETDQHVSDEPETDQHVSDEPETDQHVSDEPETDQHVSDEPETDQQDSEEPDLDKILGGRYAMLGEVPWQANIMVKGMWGSHTTMCSGAIISEFWIVTQVNCIAHRNPDVYHVVVGDEIRSRGDPGERTYKVDKLKSHGSFTTYGRQSVVHDIALLRIKADSNGRGIIFGDYVQPVCLPDNDNIPRRGNMVIVTGWGLTQERGSFSDILKLIELQILDTSTCNSFYRGVSPTVLCVGVGRQAMCNGDHGNPAVYNKRGYGVYPPNCARPPEVVGTMWGVGFDERRSTCGANRKAGVHFLYGIASHFRGCTPPLLPTVFTDVSRYVSWINETIKQLSDNVDQQRLPVRPQSM